MSIEESHVEDPDNVRSAGKEYWEEKRKVGRSSLAGPASGNVPPKRDRTTEFPAIAEAA